MFQIIVVNMKSLVVFGLCLLAVTNAKFFFNANIVIDVNLESDWEEWKQIHSKEYESDIEEQARKNIWLDNLVYIQSFNSEKHTYTLGLNQFSDLTNKEYRDIFLGYDYEQSLRTRNGTLHVRSNKPLDATVDWRDKGAVTGVKNQGRCGSCWSFSATGSLEGQYFLSNNELKSFSEQQLVDCSVRFGNHGCKGGLMDNAFRYWEQCKDETEADYPYEAKNDDCRYDSGRGVSGDRSYRDISRGSIEDLKDSVNHVGPISVAMDAGHKSFQSYRSGVYSEYACSSVKLDHGVLVVGYGNYDGEDYWLVKNSWGEMWGMEGYFMIEQEGNMCGICSQASYPLL